MQNQAILLASLQRPLVKFHTNVRRHAPRHVQFPGDATIKIEHLEDQFFIAAMKNGHLANQIFIATIKIEHVGNQIFIATIKIGHVGNQIFIATIKISSLVEVLSWQ